MTSWLGTLEYCNEWEDWADIPERHPRYSHSREPPVAQVRLRLRLRVRVRVRVRIRIRVRVNVNVSLSLTLTLTLALIPPSRS